MACAVPQTLHPWHAEAATSVSGEQSQRYREELEQLIKSRMQPGERALPELKSSPAVRFRALLVLPHHLRCMFDPLEMHHSRV